MRIGVHRARAHGERRVASTPQVVLRLLEARVNVVIDWDAGWGVGTSDSQFSPGFAGIDNPLFDNDNTMMYLADAKAALEDSLGAMAAV